ncbi:MAG: sigma 54-dependent Fis family transcriptional regulator [Deltaproteobacteria bacterium]|nr:sigma 54-dependent Fis family transcriptional regulator [Deltaproteobacteria bacterium]
MDRWPRPNTDVILAPDAATDLVFHRFELSVVAGPDQGLAREFGQEQVQIGSSQANDLALSDRTVSRFHLVIETAGGTFTARDVGSTNGTTIAGLRVQQVFLDREALIELGNSRIRFRPSGDETTLELPHQDHLGGLTGASPKMRQLYALIARVATTDLPVIIEGETGTGKELVARILHDKSNRSAEPFEVLDCGAIPDTLIESELFGHVRGAFTGADRDRQGIFERADGGTVFLDELGELKPDLQPRLLRVLEAHEIRRVGDDRPTKVDVRVVAATHRSLAELVNRGLFREDLYYRLAGCRVELPPLRDRLTDIPLLAEQFLRELRDAGERRAPATLDVETLQSFMSYSWPGNIRQLRNAVERLAIMGRADLAEREPRQAPRDTDPEILLPMREARESFERRYLEDLLSRNAGDLNRAATAAEIHPKSLARLLRRYAIGRG